MNLQTSEAIMSDSNTATLSWWLQLLEQKANSALPSFFAGRQQSAKKTIVEKGWPTFALEDWKYTSLKALQKQNFVIPNSVASNCTKIQPSNQNDLGNIAQINITITAEGEVISDVNLDSIELKLLSQSSAELQSKLATKFLKLPKELSFCEALSLAGAHDALCLWVKQPAKERLFVNIEYQATQSQELLCPVLLVVVENDCKCIVSQTFSSQSPDQVSLTAPTCYAFVGEGAEFKHLRLLANNQISYHLSHTEALLEEKANYTSLVLSLGCAQIRNDLTSRLLGEKAQANLLGVNLLNAKQHVDNHTVLDHAVPNCNSLEIYKGVYGEQSKGIFDGTIIVRQDAQKTNAIQSSRALLLSEDAAAFSKPQLKIWADDVKCTHGAAVGQLDSDAIFYLRTRGINEKDARKILTRSFVAEAVEPFGEEDLNEFLFNQLNNRLDALLNIEA